eukprot:417168_1
MFVWKYMSYFRVIFMGLLSVSVVTGIYTYISNVQSIEVDPDHLGGIACSPKHNTDHEYCEYIQYLMVNQSKTHSEWNCNLHTNYESNNLYNNFPEFSIFLLVIFCATILYGIFVIIHDCTLIYYKDNLNMLTFHPIIASKDFYFAHKFFIKCVKPLQQKFKPLNKYIKCILFPFLLILMAIMYNIMLLVVLLDIIMILILYQIPIISKCFQLEHNKIPNICYVSSSWVGLARFMMAMSATMFTFWIVDIGFHKYIPSMAPNQCECSCWYRLRQNNALGFIAVTYTFTILNGKFLYSWYKEACTEHGNYHLYLIKYSVPIHMVNQINPTDVTGSILHSKGIINDLSSNQSEYGNVYFSLNSVNVKNERKTFLNRTFRFGVVVLAGICFLHYFAQVLIQSAVQNVYGWSFGVRLVMYIAAGIVFLVSGYFQGYVSNQYRKYYLDMQSKESN